MRFLTAGESHGPALTAIVEGFPASVPLDEEAINRELTRRQRVAGRGARSTRIEADEVEILSGVRGGRSLGSPITLQIQNRDWPNWEPYLTPNSPSAPGRELLTPRPGHADLPGGQKYGFADLRNVLERASARSTAARVAVGALARQLLAELGVRIAGYVAAIGPVAIESEQVAGLQPTAIAARSARSPVLTPDPTTETAMLQAIAAAQEKGDTFGGTFVVLVEGLPPGLGSHVEWDRRLDGRLGQALLSIPAVKGVAIGDAWEQAREPGSRAHDAIYYTPGRGYYRRTNRAGGLEGGITNGETLVVTAAVKPIPTLLQDPLLSVNIVTKEPAPAAVERSDTCAVPAACVVGEAAVAWVLAQAVLEKFGGDTLEEIRAAWEHYQASLRNWPPV